ncbi:MAG: hypothetical protein M0Q22_13375 [Sulfuritalea sp.]|jgi:hypothetical protein|nr:hypothetical protein [Sulfuritalea sp.]
MRRPKARPRALVLLVRVVLRQPVVRERHQAPAVLLEAVLERVVLEQVVQAQPVALERLGQQAVPPPERLLQGWLWAVLLLVR